MKRIKLFFFFLLSVPLHLFAQNKVDIPLRQIPFEAQVLIGLAFVYVVLALLFLMLFLFYPRQRLNLFFGLYNLFQFVMILNSHFLEGNQYNFQPDMMGLLPRLIGMNLLLFILYALNRIKPFFWWLVFFVLFVDFPLTVFFPGRFVFISEGVLAFSAIIFFWLAIAAFKNKNREDWLIGFIAFSSTYVIVNAILLFFTKIDINANINEIGVPFITTVSAVIYLALRYARTSTSLEQQLIQVTKLSADNLRQEQEKQQILAIQNETLEKQVTDRTSALNKSLQELKSTQAQLIQSEKMASLGELTAGIAHEIQNPLNFVNNFSEVNSELIKELKDEVIKGNMDEVSAIADDIESNSEKINHHGKRAGDIVKGMLEHSKASTGKKELTDINKLADEYLRLSYHGLRAKDKSFNAEIKTDFDKSIGKINIIPQDIGKVLLNLYNNAFYAVNEQKSKNLISYEPTVSVTTKKSGNSVLITVSDNGNGIPQNIVDKIFQPFFTTKPTGQGTGLGLSLSYDIVKAHGGEIKVETNEGEGSEFIIQLPINN